MNRLQRNLHSRHFSRHSYISAVLKEDAAYTPGCVPLEKNEWYMECRKHKNLPLEVLKEVVNGAGPEEEILSKHRQSVVRKAIWRLPEPYRELVILRVYGELPFAEIASHFGKTESWAKVTFFRGKEKLKKELEGKI